MTVTLTKEQEQRVRDQLDGGRFSDAGEVIGAAIEALAERDAFEAPDLEAALLEGVRDEHLPYGSELLERVRHDAKKSG